MESYISTQLKNTIDIYSSRLPDIYIEDTEQHYVCLFWKIMYDQDSLWEMFKSKYHMENYFNDIKYSFEQQYISYKLGIKIDAGPTCIEDEMYGRVILYYYYKDFYHNANTFFVS